MLAYASPSRARAAWLCLPITLLLAACGSAGAKDCARPEHAERGYRTAAAKVDGVVRQTLFNSAYTVLAARGGRDLDAGSRDVRRRLREASVDPATTAPAEFRTRPEYGTMWRAATGEGPLAAQAAAVTGRLRRTVTESARRLPAKDMIAWRDELDRRTLDAAAAAFFADPTYQAGFRAGHPGWDGTIDTMRRDPANQNLVNAIAGHIVTAVQSSLTAACAADG